MLSVLVTGAGGFLGRYLVQMLLARGDRVRGYSRGQYPELEALGVECQRGDLRDGSALDRACRGVEVVFHAAAVAGIWGSWQHYYQVNTAGTEQVVRACQRQGVPRLVYTSSPSVTFDGSDQCGVDESVPYARAGSATTPTARLWRSSWFWQPTVRAGCGRVPCGRT